MFTWARRSTTGYEVSSKGDARFSAFNAILPNGISIENYYQGKIKGYDSTCQNWRLGKGKPPLDPSVDLWASYLGLWRLWSTENIVLMRELYSHAKQNDYLLKDCFASTPVNQAHALTHLLNELCGYSNTQIKS